MSSGAPEAVRAAGEHGQASGARAVEPTLHELLDAAEVGVDRLPAGPAVALLADHHLELELVVLWANVAAPVDIEVTRCDGRAIALEPGQVANDILGDRGHVTSVSFGVTSIVPSGRRERLRRQETEHRRPLRPEQASPG